MVVNENFKIYLIIINFHLKVEFHIIMYILYYFIHLYNYMYQSDFMKLRFPGKTA